MKNLYKDIRVAKVLINYIYMESHKYNDEHLTQLLKIALDKLQDIQLLEEEEKEKTISEIPYLN